MCCVLSCVLKCLLSVVISLLMTMGIVLAVLGALLLWGFNTMMKGIYSIESQVTSFLNQLGIKGNGQDVLNLMATNASVIGAIAFSVGIILIAFAIVMTVAMCCCSVRLILIVIVILLSVLTLALIIVVMVYGINPTNMVFAPLQAYLQTGIINKYVSITATNPESIITNVIQITVQCCGLYNYTDFNNAPNFNRTTLLSDGTTTNISFPVSCCDYKTDFTIDSAVLNSCVRYQTSKVKNTGCWNLIQPKMSYYLNYCFATMGITIGVLLATIAVLILFIMCIDKVP